MLLSVDKENKAQTINSLPKSHMIFSRQKDLEKNVKQKTFVTMRPEGIIKILISALAGFKTKKTTTKN
jgi:hypothetical protein